MSEQPFWRSSGPVTIERASSQEAFPKIRLPECPSLHILAVGMFCLFATVQVYRKLEFLILISFGEGILDMGKEMLWDSTVLQGPRLREARQHITAEKSLKGLRGVLTCPWSYSSSHEGIQFGLS